MLESATLMEKLRELRRLKEAGGELPEQLAAASEQQQRAAEARDPEPLLSFTPSVYLTELARPADR